jgi:transcriptional regulator GlxA family with amidase domain
VDVKFSISAAMLDSLDKAAGMDDLARRLYRSRSGFFRLFEALIEETPRAMRRRLLLERAGK